MATKQMLDQFYSLSGKTVAEKLRYLNHLISDLKSGCSQHEIDEFIAEIRPKNAFEKLLKGRLIDLFQSPHELVNVLKCNDKLFIKQVLGCDWFFEGYITGFPSCEYFMTEVFPNTSFSTRNSIIHMLSVHLKDISLAEQLFEAIKSQYGIKQAKPLLCNCSANFIQQVLDYDSCEEVNFTQKEVFKLCNLHPNLVKDNITNHCFYFCTSYILKTMIDVNVEVFIELYEKRGCFLRDVPLNIGRRASKKIIRYDPVRAIHLANSFVRILQPKYLHKYFTAEEFKQFYVALFPDTIKYSWFFSDNGYFYTMVDSFLPAKRLEMILGCFEDKYGECLLSKPDLVGEKLLKYLPPEQREQCAQQKIDKCLKENSDETYWMCYLTIQKSIPKLKKCLLQASDIDERSKFISFLILTCKINEDLEALDSVCKYVVSRYRNDNFLLRAKFLTDLSDKFDLLKLEDRHWSSILEVIKFFFLNEEFQRNINLVVDILVKSIYYKLNRNDDISEQIDQLIITKLSCADADNWFLKKKPTSRSAACDWGAEENPKSCCVARSWILLEEVPKYQAIIFEVLGNRIPGVGKVKVPLTYVALSLLHSVSTWNANNKLFQWSLSKFPWAIQSLKKIIEADLKGQKKTVMELLTCDSETQQILCPDYVPEKRNEKNVTYFLKMDLEKFVQNAEEEMQFLLGNNIEKYKHVFKTWNFLSFAQVKETVVQICTRIIENDPDTQKQANAIFVLSFLIEADSFSSLISPFCPVTEKIAVQADETEKMLPLSKTSAMCLKNISPWNDYSTVSQFCKGDYLKYVLGCVMSVCYNTSENKIVPFLEKLTNSPVSVKKHAMRLAFTIVRKPQILPLLRKLWSGDQNPATREVLFRLVFDALLMQRTLDVFDLFKCCISSFTIDDKNLFDELCNCEPIPYEYKAEYTELCWHKLHDLLQQGAKIKHMISKLAKFLYDLIYILPPSFCEHVLKQYLTRDSPLWNECVKFAAAYLVRCNTEEMLDVRFELILNLLKGLHVGASGWKNVADFFSVLCTQALRRDHEECAPPVVFKLLQECVDVLPSLLSPVYYFETFVILQFTSLYYSCRPEFNLQDFGKVSSDYVANLIKEYGRETTPLVSTTFQYVVKEISDYNSRACLNVIRGLLMEPTSKHAYIMTAHLMHNDFAYSGIQYKYIKIINRLLKFEDKTVTSILSSLPIFKKNFHLFAHVLQTNTNI